TMSCSSSRAFQPGMAVPGLPWVTVAMRLSRGLPASASWVMAGPRPPVMRRPWQEPQSWTSRCSSWAWRSALGAAARSAEIRRRDAMASPRRDTAWRDRFMTSSVLLLAKNPLGEDLGFFFGHSVWRHRDRAPDALAAVLDVASEQVGGAFLTIVLGSYVL